MFQPIIVPAHPPHHLLTWRSCITVELLWQYRWQKSQLSMTTFTSSIFHLKLHTKSTTYCIKMVTQKKQFEQEPRQLQVPGNADLV